MDAPDPRICLVTGATGLLGSHIAEKLRAGGDHVRALARPGGDFRFLESLGLEIQVGNLADPIAVGRAVDNVDEVYHCAAKVGDWGLWSEFRVDCLEATERLALASIDAGVGRFLHISSTSAYGHPVEGGPPIDETAPLGRRIWPLWDYYTRSKVESERILWKMARESALPLTVIRPSWLYGERDRITLKRLVGALNGGKVPLIGPGDNPLSAIYAGNVADAAILAARDPGSIGEAYNITDQGPMTQRDFLGFLAGAAGADLPARHVPYPASFAVAFGLEAIGRLTRRSRPPFVTRYATWIMARSVSYSTEKARLKLGWTPALGNRESIERSVRWFLQQPGNG